MDDMKKLVEKYKRELMEYSRAAPAPEKLSFPEMIREEAEEPAPQSAEPPKTPQIIGYSDDQTALDSLEKYFAELGRGAETPREDQPGQPQSADVTPQDDFNSLPPQFTDEAPQNDFTNDAVTPPENNTITGEMEPEREPRFHREGENTAAEPGQIENIGEIPVSGQSPDEQLGRRSFEDQQTPVNSREDIKPLVQEENGNFPKYPREPDYADLDEFLKANPRQGSLRFRTYTARNALPVEGTSISVTKIIGGKRHIFYELVTDISGQTEEVNLPAPSSELSQEPSSGVQPYSLYDADIRAKGYAPVSISDLTVFEGIMSIQRAALVPSAGVKPGEVITEKEPDLTEVSDA